VKELIGQSARKLEGAAQQAMERGNIADTACASGIFGRQRA